MSKMKLKNITMKEFNRRVNTSCGPEQKFKRWEEYRGRVNQFIEELAAASNGGTGEIIVFGAGECNDLDLNYLCSRFKRVVLTDVDSQSLWEGIKRQPLGEDCLSQIEIREVEYTGLGKLNFFEKMLTMVSQGALAKEILKFMDETFEQLNNMGILEEYKNRFSAVVTAPVYTQLVYTQYRTVLEAISCMGTYGEAAIQALETKILEYLPEIIERYNVLLLSMAAEDSVIGMWTDMLEVEVGSKMEKEIKKALDQEDLQPEVLERYIVERAGRGLSYYGREDLQTRLRILDTSWWIWPFDESKSYLVYGCFGVKALSE